MQIPVVFVKLCNLINLQELMLILDYLNPSGL